MSPKFLTKPWPYIALLIAHLIWGGNFVVAKLTLQEFPLHTLAFLRFFLATILIAPFFLAETKKIKIDLKDLPQLIIIGVLLITLNITFFFEGMLRTTAINASVIILIIPILSVVLGWAFLREKVYFINLLGILLGLGGALVIIGLPQIILGNYTPEALLGNIFIVLASLAWVAGSFFSRKALKKYPSLLVTGIAFLVGVVTFFVPAVREYIADPNWPSKVTLVGWIGLIYMTTLSSISSYFLFEWGLAKTSLTTANLFSYVEPFVAAALAVSLLNERPTFSFVIGAVLIVLGVYWGTLGKEVHHRIHKTHRH